MVGQTISHYRILEKLGEGGMGVVYKAEDTKLNRLVALKFLPAHLLGEADIRKRFEREAKSAAALSHANVCRVYEIDEVDGKTFIAMELVEGESLDRKIAQGPLKIEEAIDIAQQVAKGLGAAHEKDVVHRDVKPENIMVGPKGHVTVMDFGLAQLTQASRLTRADQTMGTTAYMSPEQTQGSGVDHRSDIWSLGVVLHQMVTGQQPFKGDYDKAVMYSILNEEPEPITALRTGAPMELERIIGKCLAKSPENRYATVGDLSVDIVNLTQGLHSNALTTPRTPARAETRVAPDAGRPSLAWAAAVIFAALALTFGGLYWLDKTDAPGAAPMRFRVALPENARPSSFALSPDGQRLAYSFQDDLWIHDFSADSSARMGPASDQGAPFWSPDGRFLAFAQGGELKKLDIARGITETLCPLTQTLRGGSWSRSGVLLFADQNQTSQGIFRVPETGGRAVQWEGSKTEDGLGHQDFWPQLLPDDGHFIYFRNGESALRIGSLSSGEHRELVESDTGAQYVSSGHLLFVRDGVLRSQAFDAENLSLAGPPVSLADGVQFITGPGRLPATASEVGTLAFLSAGSRSRLTWTDRSDRELRPAGRPREYHSEFRLSPDESQVAIGVRNSYGIDLWLFDSTTGIGRILTPNQRNRVARTPAWSPDALQVAFSYGPPHLNVKRVNTAGDATRLRDPATGRSQYATDWSPDAAFILFRESESTGTDLWVFPTSPDTQPFKIFDTAFNEREGRFSPDGHWIAYSSDESGERRVFVRRFDPSQPSELGSAELVSTDSGGGPAWGPLGKELFYRRSDGMLMAVPVRLEPTFEAGPPVELFQVPGNYDTRDGWRFLTLEPVEGEQSPLNMVVNWPALLNEDE